MLEKQMNSLDAVARANKKYFSDPSGKSWVEDEQEYQGKKVNEIMASSIIDFLGDKKEVRILSPSANVATVESDMLKVLKEEGLEVDFVVGDIADNLNIDSRIGNLSDINYFQLNAMHLPFENDKFDVVFEKKGALAQYVSEVIKIIGMNSDEYVIDEAIKKVYKLLDEYFRVLKSGGVILIDSIPEEFAYISTKRIEEIDGDKEGSWDRMSKEERKKWFNEEKVKRILELKYNEQWEEIQEKYEKLGLSNKDTLLQKSPSSLMELQYLMKMKKEFDKYINKNYEFKPLDGNEEINFLTAIKKK